MRTSESVCALTTEGNRAPEACSEDGWARANANTQETPHTCPALLRETLRGDKGGLERTYPIRGDEM
ncbi:hypothetical protein EYF80_020288 [Liparis tanakae]|uniref:Uncharacterized protein n=1 Tax=Liparis tanakae TaxID=230148 RepID=A0A4Z2HWR7_9TELE|nr:hypothetical protein EYF80_020288 [Liparis tanakae]